MSLLDGLEVSSTIAGEEDRLGGGSVLESGVYDMNIEMAYVDTSKKGAKCVAFNFKGAKGSFKQTIYFTNRKGETFYERDGQQHYLPGYNQINAIALLTVGKGLTSLEPEEKMVNVYDFDQQKELPVAKEVLTEIIGQKVKLGVTKTIENKNVLDGSKYVPTNNKRIFNEVDKVFRESDGMTVTEIKAKANNAEFLPKWDAQWAGNDKDKFTPVAGAPAGDSPVTQATPDSLFSSD